MPSIRASSRKIPEEVTLYSNEVDILDRIFSPPLIRRSSAIFGTDARGYRSIWAIITKPPIFMQALRVIWSENIKKSTPSCLATDIICLCHQSQLCGCGLLRCIRRLSRSCYLTRITLLEIVVVPAFKWIKYTPLGILSVFQVIECHPGFALPSNKTDTSCPDML